MSVIIDKRAEGNTTVYKIPSYLFPGIDEDGATSRLSKVQIKYSRDRESRLRRLYTPNKAAIADFDGTTPARIYMIVT